MDPGRGGVITAWLRSSVGRTSRGLGSAASAVWEFEDGVDIGFEYMV